MASAVYPARYGIELNTVKFRSRHIVQAVRLPIRRRRRSRSYRVGKDIGILLVAQATVIRATGDLHESPPPVCESVTACLISIAQRGNMYRTFEMSS